MLQSLEEVKTAISIFADDDVFWPPTFLSSILAPFEVEDVGAVGPTVSLERPTSDNFTVWDFLASAYLRRLYFNLPGTSHIDGGISCLSGRTAAFRSSILQTPEFGSAFAIEKWFGGVELSKADDDSFLTSNITSLFVDKVVWRMKPWSAYAIYLRTFNPPAVVCEEVLAYLLYHAYDGSHESPGYFFPAKRLTAPVLFGIWTLFAKTVKLVPHFWQYPGDLRYLPASWAFCYCHGVIKIWALLTIDKTTWDGGKMDLPCLRDVARGAKEDGHGEFGECDGFKAGGSEDGEFRIEQVQS
ncbi:MAG: hypothetical protein Q9218_005965 [Villophora microphyllina]